MDKQIRQLDIYIDESGNLDSYSKDNLIYSVAFVLVDSRDDNSGPISVYGNKLERIVGNDHFIHTGNLVRKEKPYKDMKLRERQDLFYILFLLAKHSKIKVLCSVAEKKNAGLIVQNVIEDSISLAIKRLDKYIPYYDKVIIHYDDGQLFLKQILVSRFGAMSKKILVDRTLQKECPFMQVADLFSYFELLKYKISKSGLKRYEEAFFGTIKKIKKDYLSQLDEKYLDIVNCNVKCNTQR